MVLAGPEPFESHSTIVLLLYHAIQSLVQGLLILVFVPTSDNLLLVSASVTTLGGTEAEVSKHGKHKDHQGQNILHVKVLRFGRARQFQLGVVSVGKGDTTVVLTDGTKRTHGRISNYDGCA
jgi:hypothetical protein